MAEQTRVTGKRVLLVEDDPAARLSIGLLLRIDRHQVAEASSGAEALQLLQQQAFDLVIVDYFMPELRGNQVAVGIRSVAPTMPIIMISAYLEKLKPSERPVDAVLSKPFGIEDLRQAIASLVT
jgi:CheY-like chemotaxis protein